jgi:hypothetical protein
VDYLVVMMTLMALAMVMVRQLSRLVVVVVLELMMLLDPATNHRCYLQPLLLHLVNRDFQLSRNRDPRYTVLRLLVHYFLQK